MNNLIGTPGQINLSSDLGKIIYNLITQNNFKNIVDVGTWNGLGTTYCILKALEDSGKLFDSNVYTVELYEEMFNIAKINLKYYLNNPNFFMLNGKLIEFDDVFWFDHKQLDIKNDAHALLWYKKDMELLKTSKNVSNLLPKNIDLLILDGGEYSTYPEWERLKEKTKFFILDDTNILKCSKIKQEILMDNSCVILHDVAHDRNGYLVGYFK